MAKYEKLKLSLTYGLISMACIMIQGFLIVSLFIAFGMDPFAIFMALIIMLCGAGLNDLALKWFVRKG